MICLRNGHGFRESHVFMTRDSGIDARPIVLPSSEDCALRGVHFLGGRNACCIVVDDVTFIRQAIRHLHRPWTVHNSRKGFSRSTRIRLKTLVLDLGAVFVVCVRALLHTGPVSS
jgi:hypothetical protein